MRRRDGWTVEDDLELQRDAKRSLDFEWLKGLAAGLAVAALAVLVLAGCTTIERVNVLTVAVDCDVERGEDRAAGGDAGASLVQQSGQATASFVGSLRSRVECRDGTRVDAALEGEDASIAPGAGG